MTKAQPLPEMLVEKYRAWKSGAFEQNKSTHEVLADEGQKPPVMMISCCDSRVEVASIFGVDVGEFFTHRIIASIVPPFDYDGKYHGTPAAIEFAVQFLKVSHIVVKGHSSCGGVQACFDMCSGNAPEFEKSSSFIGRWVDILRPAFEKVKHSESPRLHKLEQMEKEAINLSLENLMTYPFVAEAVEDGRLSLHGLWFDIKSGELQVFSSSNREFGPV